MRTEKHYMKNSESTMFGEILGKKKVFPQIQKKIKINNNNNNLKWINVCLQTCAKPC